MAIALDEFAAIKMGCCLNVLAGFLRFFELWGFADNSNWPTASPTARHPSPIVDCVRSACLKWCGFACE